MNAEIAAELLEFAEQTADFVGVTDPWGHILYLNPAARKRLGVADDATDLTTGDVFPAEAFTLYYEIIRPQLLRTSVWSGLLPVNVAGGDAVTMYVSISARVGPGGAVNESVMYGHELTPAQRIAAPDGSEVDDATGLLRRSAFDDRARHVLAVASRNGESCALVLATLVDMGDADHAFDPFIAATVVRALAGRIERSARASDVVGRVGERQIGLLIRGVRTAGEAVRLARAVYDSLVDAPVTTPGEEISPSIGCGVGFAPPGGELADLLREAAAIRWHEPPADEPVIDRTRRVSAPADAPFTMDEFRLGMSHGEVRSYAQPVVDLDSEIVIGYRGLARWHHRRLGPIGADAFSELIAETSLANQVELHVIRQTAAVVTLTTRDAPLRLYAPASNRLISDVRTEQYLCEIVDAFSLTTDQIRLQLARTFVNNSNAGVGHALESLRAAQFAFVVTDVFLASDAQHLIESGFDELHLAPGLTNAAATDLEARRAVTEIVRIAHDHGVLVAAADVGDRSHRDALVEIGCDLASGPVYGEPEPADTID
ncbi:MAG TPA: sensor domain-containing phosphodiesterase [Acidimicrobiia bacterium]|nr:sensor domain-containing phosphodiesterase [Acidimicrobiia bacterium]